MKRDSCTVASQGCKCFDALTDKQRKRIEDNELVITYRKGESIAKHGTFASHLVFVKDGLAKVYFEGDQDDMILKIAGPGSIIGLSSISQGPFIWQYSAIAYVDTVARLIDFNLFQDLFKINNDFAFEILKISGENSIQRTYRFYCLTHRQLFGKMADLLLCLSKRIYKSNQFELNLTRKELAELAEMAPENVVRILNSFKAEGLISYEGKQFEIVDQEGLEKVFQKG